MVDVNYNEAGGGEDEKKSIFVKVNLFGWYSDYRSKLFISRSLLQEKRPRTLNRSLFFCSKAIRFNFDFNLNVEFTIFYCCAWPAENLRFHKDCTLLGECAGVRDADKRAARAAKMSG